jgi:hypothetical protein
LPQGHGYRGSRPAVLHRYDVTSAPVSGFGIILSIVGFALAKDRFQIISAAYLVSIRRRDYLSGTVARVGLGFGDMNLENELKHGSRLSVVYDGDCPLCSAYVTMTRIRDAVGMPTLVNARERPDLVRALALRRRPRLRDGGSITRAGRMPAARRCTCSSCSPSHQDPSTG